MFKELVDRRNSQRPSQVTFTLVVTSLGDPRWTLSSPHRLTLHRLSLHQLNANVAFRSPFTVLHSLHAAPTPTKTSSDRPTSPRGRSAPFLSTLAPRPSPPPAPAGTFQKEGISSRGSGFFVGVLLEAILDSRSPPPLPSSEAREAGGKIPCVILELLLVLHGVDVIRCGEVCGVVVCSGGVASGWRCG